MRGYLLALVFALAVSQLHGQPFAIGFTTLDLVDTSRDDRPVPTRVYYPATQPGEDIPPAPGTFPVLVFGHGFAISIDDYAHLWNTYVPQGYLLCLPDTETGTVFPPPDHQAFGEDLAFLGHLFTENPPSFFAGSTTNRLALMGHSMGGGAAILGAMNNELADALVLLAPANTSPSSVSGAAAVHAPVLIIAGGDDCVTPDDPQAIYDNLPEGYRIYVDIDGGTHCHFTSGSFVCNLGELNCPEDITMEAQHAAMDSLLTPWLDYYLRDDCAAWDSLISTIPAPVYLNQQTAGVPPLEVPQIVVNDLELSVNLSGSYDYQWLLDGEPVPGANQNSWTAAASGAYSVEITNSAGCSAVSAEVTITLNKTRNPVPADAFRVFPNPANVQVQVHWQMPAASLTAIDVNGLLLSEQPVLGLQQTTLSVANWPPGWYVIQLRNSSGEVLQSARFQVGE